MKFHKQQVLSNQIHNVAGDCLRTCIACILDCEQPQDVPHIRDFSQFSIGIRYELNEWLANWDVKGLRMFETQMMFETGSNTPNDVITHIRRMNRTVPATPMPEYILYGRSIRGGDHAVVVYDDSGKIWDPHPSDAGLCGPCSDGFYRICVLARVN